MKKFLLSTLLLLSASAQTLMAVPARRDVVKTVTQPDGTELSVRLIGDEKSHCYITTDGKPLLTNEEGAYCYATLSTTGEVIASSVIARNVAQRSASDNAFLASISTENVGDALLTRQQAKSKMRRANKSTGVGLMDTDCEHFGETHPLVILVAFSNKSFSMSDPLAYYEDFLNGDNFTKDGGTGSCRKFYMDGSNNQYQPTFDVYGPATISSYSTYGANDAWGNDKAPEQMVIDACKKLDSQIDFSKYDTNGDGKVDNIYIIYAGAGEASYGAESTIWPHQWTLTDAGSSLTLDGVKIDSYGCCNEYDQTKPSGIGTFCHEFGHVLGLPDLYSVSYNSAQYLTPGSWNVMDYGSYNNDGRTPCTFGVYERNAFGWVDPIILDGASTISLENILDSNTCAAVLTSSKNEFFLLENRQQTGWDKYLPGHGLLIWHIDYSASVWSNNVVNNTASHQYVDIEEANGKANNDDDSVMAGYPFPGTSRKTSFTDTTSPSMKTWSGTALNTPITNITEKNGIITFDVCGGYVELDTPVATVSDIKGNGFTVSWAAINGATSYAVTVTDADHNTVQEQEVSETSIAITRLQPETLYYVTVVAKHSTITSDASEAVAVNTTEATFDMLIPVVEKPVNVTSNSFTASWQPVEGAAEYLLTVVETNNSKEETVTNDFGSNLEGWSNTATGTYGATSKGYFGAAAPSLKLGSNLQNVVTPVFDNDVVKFSCWARLAGTTVGNYFELQGRGNDAKAAAVASDDETWQLLATQTISTTGTTYTVNDIPQGIRQLRLVYYKDTTGNMALDDMSITTGGLAESVLEGYNNREVGNVTTYTVEGLTADQYSYTVVARAADGTLSEVSDAISFTLSDYDSISDIATDAAAESQLFNLQGARIYGTPAPGIYIRRTGNQAEKVIIR